MSKGILFKLLLAVSFLAAAVLWLLSVLVPKTFGFFNLSWAVTVFAGIDGVALLLRGIFAKRGTVLKRIDIGAGALLTAVAVVSLVVALKWKTHLVWPIVAVILAAALVIGVVATGGKNWDHADNHKVGYRNYYQRKEAERKEAEKRDDE